MFQVVPADLAYGDRGAGEVIPPGATLLFDIVVVSVEKVQSVTASMGGFSIICDSNISNFGKFFIQIF